MGGDYKRNLGRADSRSEVEAVSRDRRRGLRQARQTTGDNGTVWSYRLAGRLQSSGTRLEANSAWEMHCAAATVPWSVVFYQDIGESGVRLPRHRKDDVYFKRGA